jgi:multidrug efflux pump subunit AcrA (membrane-fusion protein)
MQNKDMLIGMIILAAVALLTGCGGSASADTADAAGVPVVVDATEDKVVAEAVIEPDRWSELRFDVSGDVAEVLVQEGDQVAAGDALVVLETEELERAIAQSDLDLNQAQLRLSQSQLSLGQAQLRLEQLQEPADEADVRQAEHAVTQAAAAIEVAQLNLTAVLNYTLLNETLDDAQEVFDDKQRRYQYKLEEYEEEGIDYWFVEDAQEQLDDATLDLDRIRQQGDTQLQEARNALQQAQQSYREAQDALDELLEGADALEVKLMQRDIEAAAVDIEAAEVDIEAAQLSLEEARSNLEEATLRAPFAGTVTHVDLDVGEPASPGEVVLVLATLDQLQARTVDLTELDVARVVVGQPVVVTADALPDQQFAGVVRETALQAGDYRGDVVYAVTVELTDLGDAPLRWGMTALVEIEVD